MFKIKMAKAGTHAVLVCSNPHSTTPRLHERSSGVFQSTFNHRDCMSAVPICSNPHSTTTTVPKSGRFTPELLSGFGHFFIFALSVSGC